MVLGRFGDKAVAAAYASFRPEYPAALYDAIFTYCRIEPGSQQPLAVDLACGPGISTRPLTKHFSRVIGIDISQAQIENAPKIPNVEFRVGPAEDLSFLPEESVDLIATGSGLHWLNKDHLFTEVQRVLRPAGTFAAYAYGLPRVDGNRLADQLVYQVWCCYQPPRWWARNIPGKWLLMHWLLVSSVAYSKELGVT